MKQKAKIRVIRGLIVRLSSYLNSQISNLMEWLNIVVQGILLGGQRQRDEIAAGRRFGHSAGLVHSLQLRRRPLPQHAVFPARKFDQHLQRSVPLLMEDVKSFLNLSQRKAVRDQRLDVDPSLADPAHC